MREKISFVKRLESLYVTFRAFNKYLIRIIKKIEAVKLSLKIIGRNVKKFT